MDKVKAFFAKVGNYLKERWIGFYLLLPVVVLSFIVPFVYMSGFFGTEYESIATFVIPFLAIVAFALAFFKPTAKYAPLAIFVVELVALLVFIKTSYMHLTTVFFGGIEGNVLEKAGVPFSFTTIVLVLNMLISAVAMFFAQYRSERGGHGKQKAPIAQEEDDE